MNAGRQKVSRMTINDKINGSKCIINLATGRYIAGQERLRTSLTNTGYTGEFLGWTAESHIGADLHQHNPYAFKINAFREAERQGHRFILWVDASVWAIKDVKPIFDHIEKHGYLMQEAGHMVGRWANDKCLEYFGVDRDDAMELPCYGNAGFLGLDLWDTRATTFLNAWENSMKAGAFKGSWNNDNNCESSDPRCSGHRHDLVCGSIIANKLSMDYQKGDEWLAYASPSDEVNDTIILKANGL